jgi:transcriptional regulator with XRE-family HTH domain
LKQYEGEALNFHERRKRRLSERLRLLMDEKGLSVTAAARLVKEQLPGASFNPANISHYRAGRSVPRPNVLRALSAILNVDPEDLAPQQEAQEDVAIKPQAAKGFESEVSVVAKRGLSPARIPSFHITESHNGEAFLQINQKLSWATAIRILQVLKLETDEG